MADTKAQQIEIAGRLQLAVLEYFETGLKEKTITATDVSTLTKLLMANGWTIDPSRLPQGLRGVLTERVDPTQFADDDADVVGKIA